MDEENERWKSYSPILGAATTVRAIWIAGCATIGLKLSKLSVSGNRWQLTAPQSPSARGAVLEVAAGGEGGVVVHPEKQPAPQWLLRC